MYALVCLSVLACAFAAPQYYRPPPPPSPYHYHHQYHRYGSDLNEFFGDGIFNTNNFWSDFSREISELKQTMNEFMQHLPKSESTSGLQGNQNNIKIVLQGFEEKEITVEAREGLIVVQAEHKMEDVGEIVLPVILPVKSSISRSEASVTTDEVVSTQEPDREEITDHEVEEESNENENNSQNADVGVRGDNEVYINEFPHGKASEAVESTTHAVALTDEVEVMPALYYVGPGGF